MQMPARRKATASAPDTGSIVQKILQALSYTHVADQPFLGLNLTKAPACDPIDASSTVPADHY
jgi:hypothetical protein